MKTTLVRLSSLLIAAAALTLGLRADPTNLPPSLGLEPAPAPANPGLAPIPAPTTTTPPLASTNAPVAAKKKAAKAKPAKLPGAFSGTVGLVNTNAMTITLAGKNPGRVLTMGSQSRLFRKAKPLTLADVKTDDHIEGQVHKNDKGTEVIVAAYISTAKPAATTPAKKKAAKKPAATTPASSTNSIPAAIPAK